MTGALDPKQLPVNRNSFGRWWSSWWQLTRREPLGMMVYVLLSILVMGVSLHSLGSDLGFISTFVMTPFVYAVGIVLYAKADTGHSYASALHMLDAGAPRWLVVAIGWTIVTACLAGLLIGLGTLFSGAPASEIASAHAPAHTSNQGVLPLMLASLTCRVSGIYLLDLFTWWPVTTMAFVVFVLGAPLKPGIVLTLRFLGRNASLMLSMVSMLVLASLALAVVQMWPWAAFVVWPLAALAPLAVAGIVYVIARESFFGQRENHARQQRTVPHHQSATSRG